MSYDYLTEKEKTKFDLQVALYYMLTPTKVYLKVHFQGEALKNRENISSGVELYLYNTSHYPLCLEREIVWNKALYNTWLAAKI